MAVIALSINNHPVQLDIDPDTPLLWALRDHVNLVGTKFGCGSGFCGACTVHLDGVATRSCSTPLSAVSGRRVTTIEGLSMPPGSGSRESGVGQSAGLRPGVENRESGTAALHPVQQAWLEIDVPQCGYCQAGQIMTAAALLARTPSPSDDEITAAMNGNICRCGTYVRIRSAVHRAAQLAARSRGHE